MDSLPFITITNTILPYYHILPYITIYYHILPYITIYYHILPYITIYYHILPYYHTKWILILPYQKSLRYLRHGLTWSTEVVNALGRTERPDRAESDFGTMRPE